MHGWKMTMLLLAAAAVLALGACKSSTGPDETGIELSGTVTQGGAPAAGITVYLSWGASRTATTGADGKFSFKGLDGGKTYVVTPSRAGAGFSPSNAESGTTRTDLAFAVTSPPVGVEVGNVASDFTLLDQSGLPVTLSQHHGKVILLDFTEDTCTVCREKAQTADAFYRQYRDRGFVYVLVVFNGSASNWAATYGLTFPVLQDTFPSWPIYNRYKRGSVPLPHVIDRNMTIRYKAEGWNKSTVENEIAKYL